MDRGNGLRVFFSYSHQDERHLKQLRQHCANLSEEGLVQLWHDRAIRPGQEWEAAIWTELDRADVIVLLISADFCASNFCRRRELTRALERQALVIPVLVQHVEGLPQEIQHLQGLPRDLKPIADFKPVAKGYAQVARELRQEVGRFLAERAAADCRPAPNAAAIQLPDTRPVPVYCEFQAGGEGLAFALDLHLGHDRAQSVRLPEAVGLGRSETLRLDDGVQATLGEIAEQIARGAPGTSPWFEERGRLAIGRRLFDETFCRVPPLAACDQVDLRIVTDDEHLLRLPWHLLNRRGIFLLHEAWATSLSTRTGPLPPVTFASHPRILVINPDPDPLRPTDGANHAHDLRTLLRGEAYDLGSPHNMVEVRTLRQLREAVEAGPFDLVYYYGHGERNAGRVLLLWESPTGAAEPRSILDLARDLRDLRPAPTLAYFNCLQGDAGGLLGIGNQLGSFVPSVVTNRIVLRPAIARQLGLSFFRRVVLGSAPPHEAAAVLYRDVPEYDPEDCSPEWFVPVHYAGYSLWHHDPPQHVRRRIHPDWRWLVDRKLQYAVTTERLRNIVQRQIEKRALAIVACGAPGNGLIHFQQRIRKFVHDSVAIEGNSYDPSWAPYQPRDDQDVGLRERAFQHIIESCGRPTLRELARDFRRGVAGSKALTVFNHPIVSRPEILNSRGLFEYVKWWDKRLAKEIEDENVFFLFAFYFEVPPEKQKAFLERMQAARWQVPLQHVDAEFLLPLTEIDKSDLLQFVDDYGLFIPPERRDEVAEHIIRTTGGQYERAVALLEFIVDRRYQQLLESQPAVAPPSEPQEW